MNHELRKSDTTFSSAPVNLTTMPWSHRAYRRTRNNIVAARCPGSSIARKSHAVRAACPGARCLAPSFDGAFEHACATNDIDHPTTKVRHPWTNGQAERMTRTIKKSAVPRFYDGSRNEFRGYFGAFSNAHKFA